MRVLLVVVAVALLADAAPSYKGLKSKRRTVPAKPSYSEAKWQEIFQAQTVRGVDCGYDSSRSLPATTPQHPQAGVVVPQKGSGGASLRIINGHAADPRQFPWMARLVMDNTWSCGGSVISDMFILTSGQCASGYSQFLVTVGDNDPYSAMSDSYEYAYTYKSIVHECFAEDEMNNDIGLVHLLRPLKSNAGVMPVKLPSAADASSTFEGTTAIISGWGENQNGYEPYSLRYVEQSIMDNSECARFMGENVRGTNICGDGQNGQTKVGACGNDAGGPLVMQQDDGKWMQIGINSFESDGGCVLGYPSVYTRVTSYVDWISNNTGLIL